MADSVVGRAYWELRATDDRLSADLKAAEAQVRGSGKKSADAYSSEWSKGSKRIMGDLNSVKGALAGIGIGLGVAAVANFLGDAITAASDLNETVSKTGIVFGSSADAVLALGETSATALGMSENAALSAAATYGNLFRAMGITEEKSADMSTGLVRLAADLASFNNMNPTEVLDKLRAGLSGETEPLRSLGVNLNEATIRAKAMELGLGEATGTLSAAAKAQASYALILEQTTLAQGDFDRTSGGLANQQRILEAQLADLTAEVGQKLLPAMVDLAKFANTTLVPVLGFLADHVTELTAIVGGLLGLKVVSTLTGWGAAMGGLGAKASAALGPIGLLITAALTLQELTGTGSFSGAAEQLGEIARAAEEAGVSTDRVRTAFEDSGMSALDFNTKLLELLNTGISFPEALRRVGSATTEAVEESGTAWNTYQAQITGAVAITEAGGDRIAEALPESIEARHERVRAAAYATMVAYAAGLLDAQDEPRVALDALNLTMNEALTRGAEIARLKGQLSSTHLAAGLDDARPAVRAAAQAARNAILDRLETLGVTATEWGSEIGLNFGRGLRSQRTYVDESARYLGYAVGGVLKIDSEPPDHTSPLYGHMKWGGNFGKDIALGLAGSRGTMRDAAHQFAASMVPTPMGSVGGSFASPQRGVIIGGGPAASYGGITVTVNFTHAPGMSTASPAEIEHLRRQLVPIVVDGLARAGLAERPPGRF